MDLATVVERVKKKFPEAVLEVGAFRGETTLRIRPEDLLSLCRFLREDPEMAFDFLIDLCGVDYLPREPRFQVVYHLCSTRTRLRLRLKVSLPGTDPKIASVFSVWKAADWMEREAFDMYGITFAGHPDLRRILLTPEWQGYPLRKDYPLRG
ncbi:MAG: NADH-quinone oxidoreductase subunit C [Deltaproteobacteria bacterium]|jgi:NADH-quinone oxidoreductase subunit C|nr:NADH-quinone oxidoreductase subunit C [Deltaproteobacteria bacterium]